MGLFGLINQNIHPELIIVHFAENLVNIKWKERMSEEDETKDPLYQVAYLGSTAEDFLSSDLGKTILKRVEDEIDEVRGQLDSVAFWRWRKIMDLQNKIWRAKMFRQWFGELIQDGRNALNLLESQDGD